MADTANTKKDTMSRPVFPLYGLDIGRIKSPPTQVLDIGQIAHNDRLVSGNQKL